MTRKAPTVAEGVYKKLCGHGWEFSHMHNDGKNLYEVERCVRCGAVRINLGPAKFEFTGEREMCAAMEVGKNRAITSRWWEYA